MTCAKRRVHALLITPDGTVYHGENSCDRPQRRCPRAPGEDYTKCHTICGQAGHAEARAVAAAEADFQLLRGSRLLLAGHTRICDECSQLLSRHGITAQIIH